MPLHIYSPNSEAEKSKRSWVFQLPLPRSVPVYYHEELLTYAQLDAGQEADRPRYHVFVDEMLSNAMKSDTLALRPVIEWVEGHRLSGVFRLLSLELMPSESANPRVEEGDVDLY